MVTRVNGGIINDQVLSGKHRYYKMIASVGTPFLHTTGQGTVSVPTTIIPGQQIQGDETPVITEFKVGFGQPVPGSVADRAFAIISSKCTVVVISIISSTEIHFVIENETNGWIDIADMNLSVHTLVSQYASEALGLPNAVAGDTTHLPRVPDTTGGLITTAGFTYDMSGITITEIPTFQLTV